MIASPVSAHIWVVGRIPNVLAFFETVGLDVRCIVLGCDGAPGVDVLYRLGIRDECVDTRSRVALTAQPADSRDSFDKGAREHLPCVRRARKRQCAETRL